ncbi:MAG: hypothetical protein HY796_11870 [Elusimicrobia bacterium]|nr:hypothetical protein [Elusimicrobiota bacterium]
MKSVLRENANVRQIQGDPPRRWFSDDFFDLIVWFAPEGSIYGFQLCYDREFKPRALTWLKTGGYSHDGIDDGDDPLGGHKAAPVLVQDGVFNSTDIGNRFAAAAAKLPQEIRETVLAKIREFKKDL